MAKELAGDLLLVNAKDMYGHRAALLEALEHAIQDAERPSKVRA